MLMMMMHIGMMPYVSMNMIIMAYFKAATIFLLITTRAGHASS